jgi:hypothetical protein
LPFLDVLVKRSDNKIITSVYRKATDSGRYLNYNSNHPHSTKSGIAAGLLHRAKSHCFEKQDLKNEEERIEQILTANDYPSHVLNKIKYNLKREKKKEEKEKPVTTVVIPYVQGLSEKIQRLGREVNVRVVCSSRDTLKSTLVRTKPDVKKSMNKNVVYSIPCMCEKEYIGETSRPLEVRVNEHRQKIEKKDEGYSRLVDHALNSKHQIRWDEARVLGRESHYKKRRILEAIEMARRNYDTISRPNFDLPPIWTQLLNPCEKNTPCDRSNVEKVTAVLHTPDEAPPPLRRSARQRAIVSSLV